MLIKQAIIQPDELLPGEYLLAQGRALKKDWVVGKNAFLSINNVRCEAEYKKRNVDCGRIMQHAHIGFRDPFKTKSACQRIFNHCADKGVTLDRYGLCLDWSMGYPIEMRKKVGASGTGIMLEDVEQFCDLTVNVPAAPHFGDFMLGFPGSLENTKAALAAGATSLGNLGQYFTFRLPGWDDDIETTESTVRALGLIAAQDEEILVHSNIDDGFGAQFSDLSCCLGAVLLEQYIVEDLIGCSMSHCYGHHFSDPVTRLAFQIALDKTQPKMGTMIFGATVSYKGNSAQNFASLGSYLLVDILGQKKFATGHAINPVPVTENIRIPDVNEIIEAQLYAAKLVDHAEGFEALIDYSKAGVIAEKIYASGKVFKERVLDGLKNSGFDIKDPAEMLLALRRLGARTLEQNYGPGLIDRKSPNGRKPIVAATTYVELEQESEAFAAAVPLPIALQIKQSCLRCIIATSDVHEHAKVLLTLGFQKLAIEVLDGGISTDADKLARQAVAQNVHFIAVSTYNGVALAYFKQLRAELDTLGVNIPVLIGGRLNQIESVSQDSLPIDVSQELRALGALVCESVEESVAFIQQFAENNQQVI